LSEGVQETKRISCNTCNADTNHSLEGRYSSPHAERGVLSGAAHTLNSLWRCAGCDTATLEWQLMDNDDGKELDGLIKFIPNLNLVESLDAFRFSGNEAAHRLQALTRDHARTAIEVMEDLLSFLYELDHKASRLPRDPKRAALKSAERGTVQ
jgi:hypothetical protein